MSMRENAGVGDKALFHSPAASILESLTVYLIIILQQKFNAKESKIIVHVKKSTIDQAV